MDPGSELVQIQGMLFAWLLGAGNLSNLVTVPGYRVTKVIGGVVGTIGHWVIGLPGLLGGSSTRGLVFATVAFNFTFVGQLKEQLLDVVCVLLQ